ncbi:glycosyltransferase family 2 protein [Novosphingobium album (ex Hu et al. 2023)]|uniref:Glycosyltransferase family 2 protein n=1 Tax=Novosphingobium album (ex Hu et al. 2023) TaxID=2930093 RepID=A0ABT0B4P9_9SPHN|nr:glycosyltransferase family 2 protein [Novosphingobium album (ex Hu et al. 2023)]MCJ2180017.1 glycosyltransferase family 2 protein [Novosphingobium album (ex Hu et al. 2023)]
MTAANRGSGLRIFVVIATVGRAALVRRTAGMLADQTRPADGVVVASVTPDDVVGVEQVRGTPEVLFSEKGLCRQRNRALAALEDRADVIVFLDDDFVPAPDYLAHVEALFEADPGLVGITGDLLADGVQVGGITIERAQEIIAGRPERFPPVITGRHELYGCNMAIRVGAARGLRFDENLPLYGWQEDVDFTNRLGRRGRMIASSNVTGVHLGFSGGRTSGKRLGYSQVANIVYLKRKGTMRPGFANRLVTKNLFVNALRSVKPEPMIDRRGRLAGNMLAVMDCLRGCVDPRRILDM